MPRKKIDKESYAYYKTLFRAYARYYRENNKLDEEDMPLMMSEAEWKKQHKETSNKDTVFNEFHRYTRSQAETISKNLEAAGIKVSVRNAAQGKLPAQAWNHISNTYAEIRKQGMSAKQAKQAISHIFFGSP